MDVLDCFVRRLGMVAPEIANAVRDQLLTNDYAPSISSWSSGLIRAGKPDCTDHTRANQSCVLCELSVQNRLIPH